MQQRIIFDGKDGVTNTLGFQLPKQDNIMYMIVRDDNGYVLVCKKLIILYISLLCYTFVNHSF